MEEEMTEGEKLLEFALDGEHNHVGYLTCPEDVKAAKTLRSAHRKIAKGFRGSADALLGRYAEGGLSGVSDYEALLGYRTLKRAEAFYRQEAAILDDRLDEWRHYLMAGHLIDVYLLWKIRPEEDRYDHRFPLLRIY